MVNQQLWLRFSYAQKLKDYNLTMTTNYLAHQCGQQRDYQTASQQYFTFSHFIFQKINNNNHFLCICILKFNLSQKWMWIFKSIGLCCESIHLQQESSAPNRCFKKFIKSCMSASLSEYLWSKWNTFILQIKVAEKAQKSITDIAVLKGYFTHTYELLSKLKATHIFIIILEHYPNLLNINSTLAKTVVLGNL